MNWIHVEQLDLSVRGSYFFTYELLIYCFENLVVNCLATFLSIM